jgi:hypothetical protein
MNGCGEITESLAEGIAFKQAHMKKPGALQQVMEHTTEELNRLSPEEKEQLQADVRKQFGLPPLATMRHLACEAVIFTLLGALSVGIATLSLTAGLFYGSVAGLGIWIVYRLLHFALT